MGGIRTTAAILVAAAAALAAAAGPGTAGGQPQPGDPCSKAGDHTGYPNGTLICVRKAGKLVWELEKPPAPGSKYGKPGTALADGKTLSGGNCRGRGATKLGTMPMRPSDFRFILPYGLMSPPDHVLPVDHQYYQVDPHSRRDAYPVYAMADAHIVRIESRPAEAVSGQEYRIHFSVTCTLFYYYDLVTSLTPRLQAAFEHAAKSASPGNRIAFLDYPVKAGEEIARIGGQTLDFGVWDTTKRLHGFAVPSDYTTSGDEAWKLHVVDPLAYVSPPVKSAMLAKYQRTIAPRSGKFDWDVPGRLRGNWFLHGKPGHYGEQDDLAFAPDYLDPSRFWISMGRYGNGGGRYNVLGNAPDPARVGPTSGLVKYQLVQGDYVTATGGAWDGTTLVPGGLKLQSSTTIAGTVLVKMTGPRTLRFEAFPGKTAAQVAGFDAAAKTYSR